MTSRSVVMETLPVARRCAMSRSMSEPRLRRAGRRISQLADRSVTDYFRDGCSQRAAAISFYALFSLFPLAMLAATVMGLIVSDAEARTRVVDFVLNNLPLSQSRARHDL